ncbi:hypothetical protein GCM10018980_63020 [Streptomyces capoamus]|uniref:Uncharacterized protein n=1 Tax=Streptomyces capoamus TaxID=68183 RepID=A0A919F1J8_9ACTN|nr:hypothetical protein [Streptomyces capoamus]GGW14789.1 hypothetical protein GCM10010501_24060 [Streptomyces libani subsp. rufus]GHG68997.1 hypothetical protein GCM10018980_63020 [Streptomyces capoamus]
MSARRWAVGTGAVVVLVATGTWAARPGSVDTRLWDQVRPLIEARLAADSDGTGYGGEVPTLHARWFCRAEALDLAERGGEVRAGVDTLCLEYGVREGGLVECSGGQGPQVLRLERDPHGGYRVVSREAPPDGAGNAEWTEAHFGFFARAALDDAMPSDALENAARAHFGLPADAPVGDC